MLAGAVKAAAAAAKASKSSSGGSSSSSSSGSSGSSGSSSSGSSGASMAATGKGGSYSIGSDEGKNFVSSAAAGSTFRHRRLGQRQQLGRRLVLRRCVYAARLA